MQSSSIVMSDDRKEVIINFGGIYPFDTVSFVGALWGNYDISAFDGSSPLTANENIPQPS